MGTNYYAFWLLSWMSEYSGLADLASSRVMS